MKRSSARVAVVVASMFATAACASLAASPRGTSGDGAHLDRLTFGLSIHDTALVSDSAWDAFIRDVVTPRFPQGFAWFRTEGQWQYANGKIAKEPGRIIELIHVPDSTTEARVEEIARYFVKKFDQEAVGRQIIQMRNVLYTP